MAIFTADKKDLNVVFFLKMQLIGVKYMLQGYSVKS